MGTQGTRTEERSEQILKHSKEELAAIKKVELEAFRRGVDEASRVMKRVGEARAYREGHVRYGLQMIKQWMEIKAAKPWKLMGQTWEEWAHPNLGPSYKTIDNAINNVEHLGEDAYELLEAADLSIRDLVALRRSITKGTVALEGHTLIVGRDRIDMDRQPEQIQALVSSLREQNRVRDEAIEAKEAELARQHAASEKREAKLHELLEAKDKKIAHYEMTPESTALGTEADARFWAHLKDWQKEMELRFLQVDALMGAEGHSGGFWYELGTLIGWMQEELHQRGKALLLSRGGDYMEFARLEQRPEVQLPPGRWPDRTAAAGVQQALDAAETSGLPNGHGTVLAIAERTGDNGRTSTSR